MKWWDQMPWSWFLNVFKPTFSLSSFTFIKRFFSSSLSAIKVVSSAYLRLLIFLPEILIPAYASSSLAFQMMYSAYKLNKAIPSPGMAILLKSYLIWEAFPNYMFKWIATFISHSWSLETQKSKIKGMTDSVPGWGPLPSDVFKRRQERECSEGSHL